MESLKYPIGQFDSPAVVTLEIRRIWIEEMRALPKQLSLAVMNLSQAQLDTPYRPEGWSMRQVVHHVADSHMNSFIRLKLALTEDSPLIKPYEEALWAMLPDGSEPEIEISLTLLEALHLRYVYLLEQLKEEQWNRSYRHPVNGDTRLDIHLGLYAWHGKHHVAHLTSLRQRMKW
ncbi:YfiT family bacillithiol transferase [Paenibacillus pini]|uniref:YfiT family bacillithiol transferase n=1 Tax=Paenibacillus pini TaxID=669461 RepID=UPI00155DBA89|nr:putative metal-dependent hydrolase [Paenibacillus pini]